MKFFKLGSNPEDEIYSTMENNLSNNFIEEETEHKVIAAINEINMAAEIFDELGNENLATVLTDLVVKLAEDVNDFKTIIPDTKNLTPEKEVKNLKQFGWVFDLHNNDDLLGKPDVKESNLQTEADENEQEISRKDLDELANKHGLNLKNEDEEDFEET